MSIKSIQTTRTILECDDKTCSRTMAFEGTMEDINFEEGVNINPFMPAGWRLMRLTGVHGTDARVRVLCSIHSSELLRLLADR